MIKHLPECEGFETDPDDWCFVDCICDALDACEDRVMYGAFCAINDVVEKSMKVPDLGMYKDGTGSEDPYERGYHNGLLAAAKIIRDLVLPAEGQ